MRAQTVNLKGKTNLLHLSVYIQLEKKITDVNNKDIISLLIGKLSEDKSYSIFTTVESSPLKYVGYRTYFLHDVSLLDDVINQIKKDDKDYNIGRIHFIEDTITDKFIADVVANIEKVK